mmetsp:Transcript_104568/g.305301  ORF Transcript_104568/g.305301 Transcript_104568/m.305301 type:complete len:214 (+) Transcript_104568:344-985(+)
MIGSHRLVGHADDRLTISSRMQVNAPGKGHGTLQCGDVLCLEGLAQPLQSFGLVRKELDSCSSQGPSQHPELHKVGRKHEGQANAELLINLELGVTAQSNPDKVHDHTWQQRATGIAKNVADHHLDARGERPHAARHGLHADAAERRHTGVERSHDEYDGGPCHPEPRIFPRARVALVQRPQLTHQAGNAPYPSQCRGDADLAQGLQGLDHAR